MSQTSEKSHKNDKTVKNKTNQLKEGEKVTNYQKN